MKKLTYDPTFGKKHQLQTKKFFPILASHQNTNKKLDKPADLKGKHERS